MSEGSTFRTVLRGYEPTEVDRAVADLQGTLSALRQHAAERDRTSAMLLQKRRQGPDRKTRIALGAENAGLVLERRRIDSDNHMRRVDPEIRQHVLIKNCPQKSIQVFEPREEVPRRGAPRSPVETGRDRKSVV